MRGPATSGAWMKASEGLGKLCVAHEKRTLEWLEPPPAWRDQVGCGTCSLLYPLAGIDL